MSKGKTNVKTRTETDENGEESTAIAALVTEAAPYSGPLIDPQLKTKLGQYGQDNDKYNTWKPTVGEYKILQLRKVESVDLPNQKTPGLLCTFLDLESGRPCKTFLGEWLVKEFAQNELHETGLPILLTYQGKIPGRKSASGNAGMEINNWQRYYYSEAEWKTLTGGK